MSRFVQPKVYWVGATSMLGGGIEAYLKDTGQEEFWEEIDAADDAKLSDGEILCSFYAKLCYASLVTGKNKNITKTRAIYDNILATIASSHGSVFEHCTLNFVVTNCSRVFTHELCRHRVGTAFSQTSGRYVRTDEIAFVHDPILDSVQDDIKDVLAYVESGYKRIEEKLAPQMVNFDRKKKLTSAMRRILPNGQSNEIGFSVNLRALRHVIQMRTSSHAEWEIRAVFNQVYELVENKYPAIFADVTTAMVDGANEITFDHGKI